MPLSHSFTVDDVADWLSAHEVAKGQAYLDRVSKLTISDNRITAHVKGTAPSAYKVDVLLANEDHEAPAYARCSCPVSSNCKHVAAALLAVIAARSRKDPPAQPQVTSQVTPAAFSWMEALRQFSSGPIVPPTRTKHQARLFWAISRIAADNSIRITCYKASTDAMGEPKGKPAPWNNFEQALSRPLPFVEEEDVAIIRLLLAQRSHNDQFQGTLSLIGRHGIDILKRLLETQRLYANGFGGDALRAGEARPARIRWRQDERGNFCADAAAEPPVNWALALDPPWYIDIDRSEAGELHFATPSAVTARILAAPPLNEVEALMATTVLAEAAPDVPPPIITAARVIDVVPEPLLVLQSFEATIHHLRNYSPARWGTELDVAEPAFIYDDIVLELDNPRHLVTLPDGETVRIKRDPVEEQRRVAELQAAGFERITRSAVSVTPAADVTHLWALASEHDWADFMSEALPVLRAKGWRVEVPENFRHHFLEVEAWNADIAENESGWFDLDMGIVVDGQRLALAPLLAELFRTDGRWLDSKKLKRVADTETVDLFSPVGQRIRVSAERIKPLAQTLIDLFDHLPKGGMGPMRVSALDAPRLAEFAVPGWRVVGLEAVERMAKKIAGLSDASGVTPVATPAGFALELRGYQKEGLAWLQYLREHELAGILADDMGLGKTAQTLAHLLVEKEAGRLGGTAGPALIVLPTSLIFNWKAESARFAPQLSVLSLQGKARKERFAEIMQHDLVLTTYPLLWRDSKELAQYEYHVLILDEAQTVKNASSQGAAVVRQIKARHRLCLTGTPLENHLGELWSQFDFLLPGFLGDAKGFTKLWRAPIEKMGNRVRAELLSRRIRPFILRRRKEDVAKELPPKTIIPRTVELEAGQRDLYETVRSIMDKRVRDEIAARGFARSQIVILDALLKLRQVCCDPRLVKSEAAQKVKERAKLDQLMGMLPELVDEGRKVLVFSQFTSMLALIEAELKVAKIDYALLTGETLDREAEISKFQDGNVPVFLISLKAGGIGLNLTAADTVIHYDPWWNPAVENQATDRAHRLGQTKPVFVYKLIVAGSIEEKIVALQEQKAELANAILSSDGAGEIKFSESDIQALLAPLPPAK